MRLGMAALSSVTTRRREGASAPGAGGARSKSAAAPAAAPATTLVAAGLTENAFAQAPAPNAQDPVLLAELSAALGRRAALEAGLEEARASFAEASELAREEFAINEGGVLDEANHVALEACLECVRHSRAEANMEREEELRWVAEATPVEEDLAALAEEEGRLQQMAAAVALPPAIGADAAAEREVEEEWLRECKALSAMWGRATREAGYCAAELRKSESDCNELQELTAKMQRESTRAEAALRSRRSELEELLRDAGADEDGALGASPRAASPASGGAACVREFWPVHGEAACGATQLRGIDATQQQRRLAAPPARPSAGAWSPSSLAGSPTRELVAENRRLRSEAELLRGELQEGSARLCGAAEEPLAAVVGAARTSLRGEMLKQLRGSRQLLAELREDVHHAHERLEHERCLTQGFLEEGGTAAGGGRAAARER